MYVFLCAYLYVSVFMRMYLNVSSRLAYQFSQVHMCKIDVCVCIMYVSECVCMCMLENVKYEMCISVGFATDFGGCITVPMHWMNK